MTTAGRTIAIGDIHGCAMALRGLVKAIAPTENDTLVTLGDYVNRGPEGRGVIEELAHLATRCTLVPLLGNHDEMLLTNRASRTAAAGGPLRDPENGLEYFEEQHFAWLESCRMYFETDTHFFVHANYQPHVELASQDRYTLLWLSLDRAMPKRHQSGKTAVVGHTAQKNGRILDRPHLKCIDTYCYGGGWLTAMDVASGKLWQVNQAGVLR